MHPQLYHAIACHYDCENACSYLLLFWYCPENVIYNLLELGFLIHSPVNLMFDLELIATENRPKPFETI